MKTIFTFLFIILLYGCASSQAGDTSNSSEVSRLSHDSSYITEVNTIVAKKRPFKIEIMSNGRIEAYQKATIPFLVHNQITSVDVKEGDKVSFGQKLGKIESFSYKTQLEIAKNNYLQALIDLEDRLLGHGYQISDSANIPSNILQMAKLRSGYSSAKISLEEAKQNYKNTYITTPIAGVVTNLKAKQNNPSDNYPYFCEVADISKMHIVFNLLESELTGLSIGQSLDVSPFALSGQRFNGKIISINPTVDEKGMIRIVGEIPNSNNKLIDGMNARIWVQKELEEAIIIPKEALLYRQNREVVFIYEDGKAIWKYVTLSNENSTEVAISEGLEEGMEIIIENNIDLAHETVVTKK